MATYTDSRQAATTLSLGHCRGDLRDVTCQAHLVPHLEFIAATFLVGLTKSATA